MGKTDQDYAQIIRWISLSNSELLPQLAAWFRPIRGKAPYNKKSVTDAAAAVDKITAVFEARLSEFTYLVGERLTLADLLSASLIFRGFQYVFGSEWRAAHPATTRWFKTIMSHPTLAETYKELEFVEKPIEYTPPKKEKKEATKAAPKKEATKAAAVEEEEPAAPAEEKKAKHPLEALGKPASFALDEWKRIYSNEETRETALPWLWKHYDPSEYSFWRFDYKYNDELTLTFMSNNLLGGFFNRLGGSTKYLFGSGVVYGENNNNGIMGVFLVRGDKHEPAFEVAPDWESYTFTQLDASKPENKEFIDDLLSWDKPVVVNGETREVVDGKVFK